MYLKHMVIIKKLSHGDNKKIKSYLKYYKFTKIEEGIKKTIIWYKDNKIWKY